MSKRETWIIKSKHIKPNDFYVKVNGSDFYTAYWVTKAVNKEQARSLVMEACEELDLGEVNIQEVIEFSGQRIFGVLEIDLIIAAAIEKFSASREAQLAAWVSSLGRRW